MVNSTSLEAELRELIIKACNISDPPVTVGPDSPLIGPDSSLGLDSLDAVEIVVEVEKKYQVRIGGLETARDVLQSLRSLADFIRSKQSS